MEVKETAIVKRTPDQDVVVASLLEQVTSMVRWAHKRAIINSQDVKDATNDLVLIANAKKAIEDKRKEYVDPLNAEVKEINAFFKQLSEPMGDADLITRHKVLAYNAEVERQRQEAEAIEAQKLELAKRETALKGEYTVDLAPVEAPEATPAVVRTDVGSTSKMMVKKWELEDISQVPVDLLLVDAGKITKLVKAGIGAIAGIRIWEEPTLQVRSRRYGDK